MSMSEYPVTHKGLTSRALKHVKEETMEFYSLQRLFDLTELEVAEIFDGDGCEKTLDHEHFKQITDLIDGGPEEAIKFLNDTRPHFLMLAKMLLEGNHGKFLKELQEGIAKGELEGLFRKRGGEIISAMEKRLGIEGIYPYADREGMYCGWAISERHLYKETPEHTTAKNMLGGELVQDETWVEYG